MVSVAWLILALFALVAIFPTILFKVWRPAIRAHITPSVSLVIVGDELEHDLARKIGNSLALNYPPEQLEILVMSPGDRGLEILRGLERRRVVGVYDATPLGKAEALNRAVSRAAGDIVILSDAKTICAPDAIRRLVRNFHDARVGGVIGRRDTRVGRLVPFAESGLFAFRKVAYVDVPQRAMSVETFLALKLASDGWRVVFEPEAIAGNQPLGISGVARLALGAAQALAGLAMFWRNNA